MGPENESGVIIPMNQLKKEAVLPKVEDEFTLHGHRWRVSFVNIGQMRFSAHWIGPKQNVTLDVQSSTSRSQSKVR